jgi:hypothetical protein
LPAFIKLNFVDIDPKGMPYLDASIYQAFSEPRTFADAENVCQAQGYHLTSVLSTEENDFVYGLGAPTQASWIGGQLDHEAGSNLSWTDGSSNNFTFWMSGEPNNYLDAESCVAQGLIRNNQVSSANQWNDVQCSSRLPFVCKTTYDRKISDYILLSAGINLLLQAPRIVHASPPMNLSILVLAFSTLPAGGSAQH